MFYPHILGLFSYQRYYAITEFYQSLCVYYNEH